jgi:hypothetical protein
MDNAYLLHVSDSPSLYENSNNRIKIFDNEVLRPKKNNVIKEINENKWKNTSTNTYNIGPINPTKDLDVDMTSVKSLMNTLGSEIDYNAWFCCMCIWKNEKYELKDFIEWSNLSTRHFNIENECSNMWRNVNIKSKKCFTINTLIKLIKRKYPNASVFKTYTNCIIQQVSEPTITYGYKKLVYDNKYCESLCEHLNEFDDVILHSHLGTGKSTAICDLVKNGTFKSIVCITPRQAFAQSILSDLKKAESKFVLYKDVPKYERVSCDFIVCQLESIHTVREYFDLVIFDECESNLAQFDSQTIKDFAQTTEHFKNIMNNAKKTIWSDAFIMDRSLKLCSMLRPHTKKLYIKNEFQPYNRTAYQVATSANKFVEFMKKFNRDNISDRNIIATGSRANSNDVFNAINQENDANSSLKNNTLLINSYTSDKITRKMQNVNEFWEQYKNVIYTTSITVGISYDSDKVFDNLMLHFSACSSTVRDMFQSSLRARTIKNNVLYYSRYSYFTGNHRFTEYNRDRLRKIIKSRDDKEEEHLEDWLIELWVFNKQEQNVNAFMHQSVLNKYLSMCGYTVKNDIKKMNDLVDEVLEFKEDEYHEIVDISREEYDVIEIIIKTGDADELQKKQYVKYQFDNVILKDKNDLNIDVRSEMFNTYVKNTDKIKRTINNVDLELKYEANIELDDDDLASIYIDNTREKLARLKEIKEQLGVKYTFDRGEVKREKMKPLGDYLHKNLEVLKTEWGLDLRKFKKTDIWTDKVALGVLNQIWSRWGFNKIKRDKEKKKQVKGVVTDVSDFNMNPSKLYEGFNEHCFDRTEY